MLNTEQILPLTVDQVFEHFFKDGSPLHFDEALKDLGDVFHESTEWSDYNSDEL